MLLDAAAAPLDPCVGRWRLDIGCLQWDFPDSQAAQALWESEALPPLAAALRVGRIELWVEGRLYAGWSDGDEECPFSSRASSVSRDQF